LPRGQLPRGIRKSKDGGGDEGGAGRGNNGLHCRSGRKKGGRGYMKNTGNRSQENKKSEWGGEGGETAPRDGEGFKRGSKAARAGLECIV